MANRIKQLREREGIKQIDLASFLNVTQGTLSNWERGIHDPDNEILIILSKKFNVTTDYLLGKSDSPYNVYNAQNIQNIGLLHDVENVSNGNSKLNELSVDENELVRIYRILDARQRHRLMSFAFDMEEKAILTKEK
ncbi:MAG: helix-turn-helix transcriptional regulator [Firmicutes bacterium]|jgi:transcriptional regulator with XRE-family HTH domain|nr:helix-turn-helix transcriptional regulator [Bacillota bacterium]